MTPDQAEDFAFAGVAGQAELLRAGTVTSRQLTQICLDRIARFDSKINAFRLVCADAALEEADVADAARSRGEGADRPLLGVPMAVKDEMDMAGTTTQLGTGSPQPVATEDAEMVKRIRRAGMVIVGKTNLPELAIWPFTESRFHGVTRNPWGLDRITGGSSGGSAAAVAAGLVPVGQASDGGGSIRIPAACCGLVGLKPQVGRVPLTPDEDHWQGMAVPGWVSRSVGDTAMMLDVVSDPLDGSPVQFAEAAGREPGRLRIAVSRKPPVQARVEPMVHRALAETVDLLRRLGHEVFDANPAYGLLQAAFLTRFFKGVNDDYVKLADGRATQKRTQHVAAFGARIPAAAVRKARADSEGMAARLGELPGGADVLLTPTLATVPPLMARFHGKGAVRTMQECSSFMPFTPAWNVTGQPAMSLPAGFSDEGVPLAVQVVGRPRDEATLLSLAAQIEATRPWADQRPPLVSLRAL